MYPILGCLLLVVVYACMTHIGRALKRKWSPIRAEANRQKDIRFEFLSLSFFF